MSRASIAAAIVGLIISIVGIVLGWYVFPMLVEDEISENVILYNNTDQFDRFEELPIPLDFKTYLFQITNPDEVNKGAKPEVEERGPYIYKQFRHKENITWNNNKISYYEYFNFEFDQTASGNLSKDDKILVLDPALNSAAQIIELTGMTFLLRFLGDNTETIFGHEGILMETTVQKFLFDGISICNLGNNETIRHADIVIGCLGLYLIPTRNIKPVYNENNEIELIFSIFSHKNGSHDGHYTINSGIDFPKNLGWIEQWNDKKHLSYWGGGTESTCNQIRGRDAVIFQPFLTKDSVLTIFNTDICRSADLRYSKEIEFRDVTAYEYKLGPETLVAVTEDNGQMCYCLNVTQGITEANGCLKNGLREIFTCYNEPILMSYPHFLFADKEYKDSVIGLKSDIEKHTSFGLLEPNTGTPLAGSKRLQFNMFVRKINGVKVLEAFEDTRLIPIIWVDEGFMINDELYGVLYDSYISKTYLITGVTWGVIGLGLLVILITVIVNVVLRKRMAKLTV